VELIIVISVLAILSVGAVLAFNGVQDNARRAMLSADAEALVAAVNNFNATPGVNQITNTAGITALAADDPPRLIFVTPARGVRAEETSVVVFSTTDHRTRAIAAVIFANDFASVDTAFIQNYTAW